MTSKLTAEQRVQKAHVALMNDPKYCLYSGVFMLGTTVVDDKVPTAYTDGRNTKYGRKFIEKLDDRELRGLILHENLHKAFRHMTIWDNLWKENPRLANMACDYVINLMIVDSDKDGKNVSLPIDTSGSIDTRVIGEFLSEVKKICETVSPEGLDLLYWDTGVCAHEKYDAGNYEGLMQTTKPAGGGGTAPQCIVNFMSDMKMKAECIIVLTDGHVSNWGEGWSAPVLWGITNKGKEAPHGRSVYIGD
jgi:predicted metal-dependent peptidase